MTANHEHTPTREQFKALLARIPAKYGEVIAHTAVLDDFDRMIDQTIAAAEQRGAIKALRSAAIQMESTADTLGEHYMLPGDIIAWLRHRADQMEGDDE